MPAVVRGVQGIEFEQSRNHSSNTVAGARDLHISGECTEHLAPAVGRGGLASRASGSRACLQALLLIGRLLTAGRGCRARSVSPSTARARMLGVQSHVLDELECQHPPLLASAQQPNVASMGRRKSFIDKKRSTTYYLVHKEVDDDGDDDGESGDRELVTGEDFLRRQAEVAAAARAKHPLAFLFVQEEDLVQNAEQRHDILELGLPDDGYNYLKHLRAPGPAASRLTAAPVEAPATIPEDSELQLVEHEGVPP